MHSAHATLMLSMARRAFSLFAKADVDGSGTIDVDEFAPFMRERLKVRDMTDDEVDRLFQALDVDGSGQIWAEIDLDSNQNQKLILYDLTQRK